MNQEMKRAYDQISSMVGGGSTPPDVLRVVKKMIQDGTAEPAVIKSVVVGLELALDIMKQEADNESPRTG